MYVLGITHPMAWNNAAALLRDGEIVLFAEEERFNRFKQSHGVPPILAMEACLSAAGIRLQDVDSIGVGWDVGARHRGKDKAVWEYQFKQLPMDPKDRRIRWVRHHIAHALSALWCSPFERAAVISLDGTGEFESGVLGSGDGAGVKIAASIPRRESWGYIFGKITEKLGFESHRDEGKVMGLAAYAAPEPVLFDFVDWRKPIPRVDKKRFKKFLSRLSPRLPGEEIEPVHRILAATVQWAYERALLSMARWTRARTGLRDAVLAGGCALNCAANGALLREGIFDRVFVQPAAHDAGTALGSAFEAHLAAGGARPSHETFRNACTGPAFSDEDIRALLERAAPPHARPVADPAAEAAALIASGRVIGWFQGAMEVGPRALGNRSILADPRDPAMRDRVNSIKGREQWRPLAPSVMAQDARTLLSPVAPSPHMLFAFTATDEGRKAVPAVVHVDSTVRAQVLEEAANPPFYRLLAEFRKITGVGAVLNTSFNAAGEPIVCSPRDALMSFYSMGLDALVIGDWVIEKKP